MPQIFISYAREDEDRVRDLYARLYALGFHLWMDKVNLHVGQRWRQEIPRQLRASALVLVCFSRAAVAKVGYIRREFNLVLDILQQMPDELIHTLPVLLEPCKVPEQFEEFNWCYLYEEDGFDRLVEGIRFGLTQRGLEVPTADRVSEPPFTNTIEELCRYAVLKEAAYGGRTKEWFLGEVPLPDAHRKEATKFLLENDYLKRADPIKATPFSITDEGRGLLAVLTEKFNMLKNREC